MTCDGLANRSVRPLGHPSGSGDSGSPHEALMPVLVIAGTVVHREGLEPPRDWV